ncbi:MAG: phenylalanine--tRNA ligase subunit beta [Tissierellia bacterium]|nr:phenylalanine--tRNA ligase subunit beta [Tissierellia bacterium]
MLLPIKWLNDYCEIDVDTRVLADKITDSGSHVDQIIDRDAEISGIKTGKVLKIEPHPNADKLIICQVDMGDEVVKIVTGAPNVVEGAVIPVATVGAKLPGGVTIEPTEFRGEESFGMMCALDELGYDVSVIPREFRDGIYIFNEDTKVGEDVVKLLDLDWDILDCEITPNRPDCLSIVGMAREAKATLKKELKNLEFKIQNEEDDIRDYLKNVTIETPNCHRYYARVLKDVKIKPSPQWMQNNLMAAGVRPINNIVDITNFVMLEYGLPLHAFDLEDLRGQEIKVYQAEDNYEFQTLDSQIRKLNSSDMVIADGEGPIGIAGIMGGMDSGIKDTTTTIVLEGANFEPSVIRRTSKRLNLRTEASSRFEKGLDPEIARLAVDRACELAEEIGAATVVANPIDIYEKKKTPIVVTMRPKRCNMLLGTDIETSEMMEYLERLDISVEEKDGVLECTVPTFRGDITIEADLIEEVGRLYGLNNIKPTPIKSAMTRGGKPYFRQVQKTLKNALKGMGYSELLTYSFISPSTYDKLMIPEGDKRREYVTIMNPLGEEYSVMRTTLLGNVLDVMSRNQNRNIENMLAYEIGNTFSPEVDADGIPTEELKFIISAYGDADFFFVKESLEKSFDQLGINNYSFERESENEIYHPGRCANIYLGESFLGTFGEIHPLVMENYELKNRVVAGEFDFDLIVENSTEERLYKPLPKYPSSDRDLAIIIDENIMMSQVKVIANEIAGDMLEEFKVFDIYTGEQIEKGKKSVAFNLRFRSHEKTLTDEEVNGIMEKIVENLKAELSAVLRD